MSYTSASPLSSFTPSAQSLPAFRLQPEASHSPQTQAPLGPHLFPPPFPPPGLPPPPSPPEPSLSPPFSTLLPSVHSTLPLSDTAAAIAALGSNPAGAKPGSLAGQSGACQRLYDTAPMPSTALYSADTYSVMTGSLPYCSSWPQKLIDTNSPNLAMPQAGLPVGPDLHLGLGKLLRSRNSSDDGVSSIDSDPAALVEDALLGELFFAQTDACQVRPCAGSCHTKDNIMNDDKNTNGALVSEANDSAVQVAMCS